METANAQLSPSREVRNRDREVLIRPPRHFVKLRVEGALVEDSAHLLIRWGTRKWVGHRARLESNDDTNFVGTLDAVLDTGVSKYVAVRLTLSKSYWANDLNNKILAFLDSGTICRSPYKAPLCMGGQEEQS